MDDQRIRIPYNCPAAALPPNFSYNDAFVRKKIMPLLCAANGMNHAEVQRGLLTRFVHVQRLNLYEVRCDTQNNVTCHAYSALLPSERAKVFVFRGARDPRMFLREVSDIFVQKRLVPLEATEGRVYDAYLDTFMRIWSAGLEKEAESLAVNYDNFDTWVLGYSLGGALASIASVFIYKENLSSRAQLKQITLGQPRTGDMDFARVHDLFVPYSFRIIHRFDPVPLLPVRDVFQPAKAQPFHHRYEVWYPNRMNADAVHVVAKSAEDPMGRTAKLESEADDHLKYFDVDVSTCNVYDV
ncbi:Protein C39B5.14 [Aphelenchoides avenae]|nr:Protein C39B5.14 [Aphelenchus avenae]